MLVRIANGFVLAFLADGVLSVLDELLRLHAGSEALGPLRQGVALLVVAAALPLYLLLGLTPRLPLSIFLPLVGFVAWAAAFGLPLPLYFESETVQPLLAGLQLGLALWTLWRIRARSGRALFDPASLAGADFSPRHTLGFAAVNALLGPVLLAAFAGVCLLIAVDRLSAGFLSVRPSGVWAEEREYVRDDRHVHLIAMIHIGREDYYEDVIASLAGDDVVVLAEGVNDRKHLLEDRFSYRDLASHLGLDAQEEFPLETRGVNVVEADVDVADLSPETVALLNQLGEIMQSESLAEAIRRYRSFARQPLEPGVVDRVWHEILALREQHLLAQLPAALERHRRVVLPWGAAHMPGLERAILADGFRRTATRARRIIDF